MKRMLSIMFILALIPTVCFSQNATGEFNLFGGIALPQGDFKDDPDDPDSGLAKTGFGVGVNHIRPLTTPGMSWITSAALLYNGMEVDESDYDLDYYGIDVTVDAGAWINIPIMTGLKYETEVSPTMKIYGLGQVGINMVKAPKLEIKASSSSSSVKAETEYDMASSFGYVFGGGIVLSEKISVGLRYFALGEPKIKGTVKASGGGESDSEKFELKQSISVLLLMVELSL